LIFAQSPAILFLIKITSPDQWSGWNVPTLTPDNLTAFGFSSRLIDRWRETGVSELLPLQQKALTDYAFLQGRSRPNNLLVLAPTSSGKTFVAELAALRHLEARRRVIYLVPTKALAEEKVRLFRERYAPLNYRIAVATRERPENRPPCRRGRFRPAGGRL
jgi:helicase